MSASQVEPFEEATVCGHVEYLQALPNGTKTTEDWPCDDKDSKLDRECHVCHMRWNTGCLQQARAEMFSCGHPPSTVFCPVCYSSFFWCTGDFRIGPSSFVPCPGTDPNVRFDYLIRRLQFFEPLNTNEQKELEVWLAPTLASLQAHEKLTKPNKKRKTVKGAVTESAWNMDVLIKKIVANPTETEEVEPVDAAVDDDEEEEDEEKKKMATTTASAKPVVAATPTNGKTKLAPATEKPKEEKAVAEKQKHAENNKKRKAEKDPDFQEKEEDENEDYEEEDDDDDEEEDEDEDEEESEDDEEEVHNGSSHFFESNHLDRDEQLRMSDNHCSLALGKKCYNCQIEHYNKLWANSGYDVHGQRLPEQNKV